MTNDKAVNAMRNFLRAISIDVTRPELCDTPRRVTELYTALFDGLNKDPAALWEKVLPAGEGEPVAIRQIPFCSVCEHHLMPFFGTADIVYLPSAYGVAGFGKFTELVTILSHRPQIQERLTGEIADSIMAGLKAQGVFVRLTATQLCLITAGKYTGQTVTTAARGKFAPGKERYHEAAMLL